MPMSRRNRGFTIIEMMFVILIGSVLIGIAMNSVSRAQNRLSVQSAKTYYETLHQRARARAVESGETVLIVVWTSLDQVGFYTQSQGVHDVVNFRDEFGVTIHTSGPGTDFSYYQCFTPKGYADYNCGALTALGWTQTVAAVFRLSFELNGASDGLTVLPLGQLVG
jgi:prepilin-type N-terminal cleavage/methylation domain-containing protein